MSLSVSRDVLSLFQSQFLKQRYLLRPLSISSILSIPSDHPIDAYVFFVIFLSLLNFHFFSCNIVFYKTVPKQDVTKEVTLPSIYGIYAITFLPDYM